MRPRRCSAEGLPPDDTAGDRRPRRVLGRVGVLVLREQGRPLPADLPAAWSGVHATACEGVLAEAEGRHAGDPARASSTSRSGSSASIRHFGRLYLRFLQPGTAVARSARPRTGHRTTTTNRCGAERALRRGQADERSAAGAPSVLARLFSGLVAAFQAFGPRDVRRPVAVRRARARRLPCLDRSNVRRLTPDGA